MIGEIGGSAEEEAAAYIKDHVTKPVVAGISRVCYRAERQAYGPRGPSLPVVKALRMKNSAALEAAGVKTVRSLADIGEALKATIIK